MTIRGPQKSCGNGNIDKKIGNQAKNNAETQKLKLYSKVLEKPYERKWKVKK